VGRCAELVGIGSSNGDGEGAIDGHLTSVGSVVSRVRSTVVKSGPKGAVNIGGNEVDEVSSEGAASSVVGLVTLEIDVECNAARDAGTEAGACSDVVGVELGVSQVVASRDSSLEISEDVTVMIWVFGALGGASKAGTTLPLSNSLVCGDLASG